MPRSRRTLARLSAYRLMEALQGDGHVSAAAELTELQRDAESRGWPEVSFLAQLGHALQGVIRPVDALQTRRELDRLVAEAERMDAPALQAHALGMRAIIDAAVGDAEAALADVGRGLTLLDADDLPPLDACTALVVCAAAYNALSLWELVDEIYDRAAALADACEEPIQAAAIAMNRVLLRLEWASALLEQGQPDEARQQFSRAAEATDLALTSPLLPDQWRIAVAAGATALRLYLTPPADPDPLLAQAAAEQATLRAGDDPEMLPLTEILVALALLRLGRPAAALKWLAPDTMDSPSSGARSFRLWVRAEVLVAVDSAAESQALQAYREYAAMLATQRHDARRALLAAAHSRIAGERLRADRDRLSRDVALDPLTGLGNRRAFEEWLSRDVPVPRRTAMLLIDLDHFKTVNDRYGHSAGDEVLRRVGRVIARYVRATDLALRLGGDEFAIIMEAGPDDGSVPDPLAPTAAQRALEVRQGIETEDWAGVAERLSVSASVGVSVAVLAAHDAGAAAALYEQADRDLYARKKARESVAPSGSGEARDARG